MHLVMINHAYDPACATPEGLLERFATLTGWVEAVAARGWKISVVQRYRHDTRFTQKGIDYHFVGDALPPMLRLWQIPTALHQKAKQLKGDVVHANGLLFPLQIHHLTRQIPRTPVIVQHHAERPWRGWRRALQRFGLSRAAGFFFVSNAQANAFREADIIRTAQPVFEIMEGSTHFAPQIRAEARHSTGLSGTPQFLWIGRLIPLKNPLVVLEGFACLAGRHTTLRLAMIYHDAPLLTEVRRKIEDTPALQRAVTLVGAVPHRMIATYLSASDYFVLGSNYEGSGYALAEAMACGVIPLVTDIPSFRTMTDGGTIGALWEVGSPESMVAAAERLMAQDRRHESLRVQSHFAEHLSYEAIGRDADRAYRAVAARRTGA